MTICCPLNISQPAQGYDIQHKSKNATNGIMTLNANYQFYCECHYDECHYAEWCYSEYRAERKYAQGVPLYSAQLHIA